MSRIGVIGGTFDPIHNGHLMAAREAARALAFQALRIVPSRQPPHRAEQPHASAFHRFAMASIAAASEPGWSVSDLELLRGGPSYTFDTLTELGREVGGPLQICFLLGSDAFAEIATWSRFPGVLDLAHFVVVARPGTTLESLKERLPALRSRMVNARDLGHPAVPRVAFLEVPTPDVSSTDLRARIHEGRSIAGLVPAAVAAHIAANRLYRDASPVSGR